MRQEGPGVPDRAPVVNFEQFKLQNKQNNCSLKVLANKRVKESINGNLMMQESPGVPDRAPVVFF